MTRMLAAAAAAVLQLAACGGEGPPEVYCTGLGRADCIALAHGTLSGPGTYRLSWSWRGSRPIPCRYVVNVPEGRRVVAFVPPEHLDGGYPRPKVLPERRLPDADDSRLAFLAAPKEDEGSLLVIDTLTGTERLRVVTRDSAEWEWIHEHPRARWVYDLRTGETTDRYPLDRVSIMPPAYLIFARTGADLLFDEIMASIRIPVEVASPAR